VRSLLHNELGVSLPLHVSLSQPLTLRTEQREPFLASLKSAISASGVRAFNVQPASLIWHPNETKTRWFLVLGLKQPPKNELRQLLEACNRVCGDFKQPLLYRDGARETTAPQHDQFHISVAWSLSKCEVPPDLQSGLLASLDGLKVRFDEVKARVGQDVTSLPLAVRRA